MARFYGTLQGNRGQASRMGTPRSGIESYTAGWKGAIHVSAYDHDGDDWVTVRMAPWHGNGTHKVLYEGPIGEYKPKK